MIVPNPVGRDEARELARRELQNPVYHRDEPSVFDRVSQKIGEWLDHLFGNIDPQQGRGGGWTGLIILLVLLIIVVAAIWWRVGNIRGRAAEHAPLLDDVPSTARDHRGEAERYAAAGDWPHAIRERLRAIARDLEERAIVEYRPGRTADELAEEAGAELPDHAEALAAGVRIFDDVWYGGRPGDESGYRRLTELDERLRSARPTPVGAGR
jgi:Domain of unknown function (DUF4129)